ncbi:MAG: nucleotidyltransferase domain-containing protein [Halobacteriota archaeon]
MMFVERENEVLKTVDVFLNEELEFVVVGGYAVSALARHRFSVDLDIVIRREDADFFESILEERGYAQDVAKAGFDNVYGGEFLNYKKPVNDLLVTVDLLIGSIVCRATTASWSFEYLNRYSVIATILGIEVSTRSKVPEKELLTALKIHLGRRTDLRDVVLLIENTDIDRVIKHLKRGDLNSLKEQIEGMIKMLKDEKLVNSLKGVFSIPSGVDSQIKDADKTLRKIMGEL